MSDFEWSPKDNVLAYWAPEQANAPARVSVVEIPSRKELRQKNLVMVSECRLHWQVRAHTDFPTFDRRSRYVKGTSAKARNPKQLN